MTPEERELLDKLVLPLEWDIFPASGPPAYYSNFKEFRYHYGVDYEGIFYSQTTDGEFEHLSLEEARAACRTHQLEQVREIFGDKGMEKLLIWKEMHDEYLKDYGEW